MLRNRKRIAGEVLGRRIDVLDWRQCLDRILGWAGRRESRYVCMCNVHSVVTARRDPAFGRVINGADLAAPDGAPVAWRLRALGFPKQQRISGPDLMWKCCAGAAEEGLPIFLYGGTTMALQRLSAYLAREFPRLAIVGCYAPPFRPMTEAEDARVVDAIEHSGARVVFVGLGCPKQEVWMAAHRGRIRAVMIGVGAAFDYHAGVLRRAPRWMRNAGLEWLHRLASEPRRLWRRYFVTNTLFLAYLAGEMLAGWRRRIGES
jgi:N-acetylglucosaminyldiphosphoundecaprenol N-acetyl-beta-D-mannosaminyltransferase